MSSKKRTYGTPYYVQKIDLSNDIKKTIRRRPSKSCPDCKETNDCIKLFSNGVNGIEEVINNFYKNFPKKKN